MVKRTQIGFSLLELLAVITIIGILAAIAYPSYQNYMIRTKRANMIAEMQTIGQNIETQKLINQTYSKVNPAQFNGQYPKETSPLYTVTVTGIGTPTSNGNWVITATPIVSSTIAKDGTLVLHSNGKKCHRDNCTMKSEW